MSNSKKSAESFQIRLKIQGKSQIPKNPDPEKSPNSIIILGKYQIPKTGGKFKFKQKNLDPEKNSSYQNGFVQF